MNTTRTLATLATLAILANAHANGLPEPKPAPVVPAVAPTPAPAPAAPVTVEALGGPSSATSTASTGPSVSGAVSGSSSGADSSSTGTGTATTGAITVAPASSMQSTSRAFAIGLPAPVAGMASASGCLVAGSDGTAVGWNAYSQTRTTAASDPVCTLRALAIEADAACQWRTAAVIRSRLAARVDPDLVLQVPDVVQDVAPTECLAMRQPRVVLPPAQSVTVEATQWQSADATSPAPPAAAPAVHPKRRPAQPVTPPCPSGQVLQCVPAGAR